MDGDQACQRWSEGGRVSWAYPPGYGPPDPARYSFDPDRYNVQPIPQRDAKRFVLALHYSGSFPAASQQYGMFDLAAAAAALVGVAVLSVPARPEVLTAVFPRMEPYTGSLELGRFVLRDEIPANAESWFFAQCRKLIAETGISGLVMFADPVPRRAEDGTFTMPGHAGVVYQASSAVYTGRGTARTLVLLPNGQVLSARAAQKIRKQTQGHEYAERALIALGARPMRAGEKPAAWLADALVAVRARRVRHPGCHRYAIPVGISPRHRAVIRGEIGPRPQPYPKTQQLAS